MHDLIQELGREIVNQESEDPGNRSRLWKPEEVYDVLKNNKGTEFVKGIRFNISKVRDLYLSSDSFKMMTNLRYIEILQPPGGSRCNVYFSDGLRQLSDKLRYVHWEACCLESLPSNFSAEMLVELRMPQSKLKKLWDGVQNLLNLKVIQLIESKNLVELPDLYLAQNLKAIVLNGCESLRQLHPSILSLPKLTELDLHSCKKIKSLKTSIHSKSLRRVDLSNCSSLTEFSVTSEEMVFLLLNGTAIRELSPSIWRDNKLSKCYKLTIAGRKLPNDPGVAYLKILTLSHCTQINASNLLFILDGTLSLQSLDLSYCHNLEAVPNNIQNHSMLTWLLLDECRKLVSMPELLPSLKCLRAVNCTSVDRGSKQQVVLGFEKMLQSMSYLPEYPPWILGTLLLPGDQVPSKLGFHTTTEASITIPPIPKSHLRGFLSCIIFSKDFNFYLKIIAYHTYEHGEKVDHHLMSPTCDRTLISDHIFLGWCDYNKQESGGDHYNLSFEFKFKRNVFKLSEIPYTKEGIKGCGMFPVYYASPKQDGSSSEEIVELESNAQISHQLSKLDSDELQCRGGVGGSNSNDEEDEDDQEQLLMPAQIKKENFNDKSSCDCFIGLLLKYLLGESRQ